MDTFRIIRKLWPTGTPLGDPHIVIESGGIDTHDTAEPWWDRSNQFLFWNTGRHLTNLRRVHWTLRGGFGTWTATKWYGTPGPGNGPARVRADAFTIGGDMPMPDTPIDAAASRFAAGAFPVGVDDHAISTVNGEADVVPKDPFNGYQFAGWCQLIFGGAPEGDEYPETDAVPPGGSIGGVGFYDHPIPPGHFVAAQGASADLLAQYGYHETPVLGIIPEVVALISGIKINPMGDVGPFDVNRLRTLQQLLLRTKPSEVVGTDFQNLIKAAPHMSSGELKRTTQSLRTTLELGQTALMTMEARLKKVVK